MQSGLRMLVIWLAVALCATAANVRADESEVLAKRILDALDRPVGLAHLSRCDRGALALAFAEADDGLVVHGQDADPSAVAAAREAADERDVLNRRVSFDIGSLDRLLPVSRSCDLVVLTDLDQQELTPALAAEVRRVLHPWYGVAVLGDISGQLRTNALTDWAKRIAPDTSRLDGVGNLVIVRAEPLNGADNWTHWWHGPDNNAVSNDYAYSLPETVQWTGKPYFSTRLELPIVANGRLFMLWNGHLLDATPGEPVLPGEEVALRTHGWETVLDGPLSEQRGPLLTARAVGSGVWLWHRRLSPAVWLQVARSTVVADGDRLLVADGPDLLVLDQATGEELRRLDTGCGEIKWVAVTDERVLLLGGAQFPNRFPERMRRMGENVAPFRSGGLDLMVLDRKTLKKLWHERREEGADAFDPRSPAAANGRLFACTEGGVAEAYRIADGKLQWKTDTGIVRQKPRAYEWDRSSRHPVSGYAVAGLYIISGPETDRCAVLSQQDGRPMWNLERGRGPVGPIPLAFRDLIWFGGNGVDPATGGTERNAPLTQGGCSRFTAAPQGIFGTEGLTWNAIADEARRVIPAKSGCGAGQYAANGLAWKFPTPCSACMEWRGFIARGPAEEHLPPAGPRVVKSAESPAPAGDTEGWTTYRADAARSMSTSARVGGEAGILWRAQATGPAGSVSGRGRALLGLEIAPVVPLVTEDTVILAGGDGAVEALAPGTGARLWRVCTGGRIYSAPAVWRDRVFVGSADGYLYAFRLEDGRELWRLRVAPQAGRIMLYEQPGSRWPVLASPLVIEGRVYAAAGLLDMLDGVCTIAADAASGRVLWERTDWKDAEVENLTHGRCFQATGQFCWDADGREVVFGSGDAPPVRLSPADGACRVAYARGRVEELSSGWPRNWRTIKRFTGTYSGARGQDIGDLGPGWIVFGGRRMLIDAAESGTWRQNLHFLAQDENGDGRFPLLRAEDCVLMPAWDGADALFLLEPRGPGSLVLVPRSRLMAALQARMTAAEDEELAWILRTIKLDTDGLPRWSVDLPHNVSPLGSALTADAALLLTVYQDTAQLTALARSDGKQLWQIDLPMLPVRDGLAVGPDGRIVVALRDGSVVCVGR